MNGAMGETSGAITAVKLASARSFYGAIKRVGAMAVPLCLAMVIDSATQFALLALLGHMGGDALYVRSLYTPIAFFILAVTEGFGVAVQIVFARLRGQPDSTGLVALARAGVIGGFVFAAIAVVIVFSAPLLAAVLEVPDAQRSGFLLFVRLMGGCAMLTIPTTLAVAALRGWGRPGWSLVLSLTTAATQVVFLIVVGWLLGLGERALPLAVLVASVVGVLAALPMLRRVRILERVGDIGPAVHRATQKSDSASDRDAVLLVNRLLVVVGIPVGMSYVLLMGANLATLWIVTPFGAQVQTAYGSVSAVQSLVIVPAIGLASATAVVFNQQFGAGERYALAATFRAGLALTTLLYIAIGLAMFIAAPFLAQAMVVDEQVRAELVRYLAIVGPSYAGLGVALFLMTLLEQLGAGVLAITLNITYYAVSLGIGGWIAHESNDPLSLYAVIAISNVVGMVSIIPIAAAIVRRRARQPGPAEVSE